MARQKIKICVSCGTNFQARRDALTCSNRCRKRLYRAKQALIAKTRVARELAKHALRAVEEAVEPELASPGNLQLEQGFINVATAPLPKIEKGSVFSQVLEPEEPDILQPHLAVKPPARPRPRRFSFQSFYGLAAVAIATASVISVMALKVPIPDPSINNYIGQKLTVSPNLDKLLIGSDTFIIDGHSLDVSGNIRSNNDISARGDIAAGGTVYASNRGSSLSSEGLIINSIAVCRDEGCRVLADQAATGLVFRGDASTLGGQAPSYYTNASNLVSGILDPARIADGSLFDNKLNTITTPGKVADSALSPNVALLDRNSQTFTGNNTFSGITTISGNLSVSGRLISNLTPADGYGSLQVGTAANLWSKVYADEVIANSIIGTSVTGGTSASDFFINTDNATADTETMNLVFERGTVTPNALLTWNATDDRFEFNMPLLVKNSADSATAFQVQKADSTVLFTVNAISGQVLLPNATSTATALVLGGGVNLYNNSGFLHTDNAFRSASSITASSGAATRVVIGGAGQSGESGIQFGNPGDTWLYRNGAGVLRTPGLLQISRDADTNSALDVLVGTNERLRITADGKISWGLSAASLDTNLYRGGADILQSDDQIRVQRTATDNAFASLVSGDTVSRWAVEVAGRMWWGPGNAALDTNLYRSATGLKTDNDFESAGDISARRAVANQTIIGARGPGGQAGIAFGDAVTGAIDTSLYRLGVDTLATDDDLVVRHTTTNEAIRFSREGAGAGLPRLIMYNSGAAEKFRIDSTLLGTTLTWQGDTNLYRSAADTLKTDDALLATLGFDASQVASATSNVIRASITGDSAQRFQVLGDGKVQWGPGNAAADTNLYRVTANILGTDDSLRAYGASGVDRYWQIDDARIARGGSSLAATAGASIGLDGPGGEAGIKLGGDTTLYRLGVDVLKTDDNFNIQTATNSTTAFIVQNAAGTTTLLSADTSSVQINHTGFSSLTGGLTITKLSTPAAPTVTNIGTPGTTSYTYAVSARNAEGGETPTSSATTTTTGNAVLDATNFNRISWTAVAGAKDYRVYRTASGGTPSSTGLIGTTTTLSFDDTGIAGGASAPTTDSSGLFTASTALFKNATDSTTAFQIQNTAGTSLFTVDTTGLKITLGPAGSTPVILVLGNKNTAGDPTCDASTAGGIYYNSSSTLLRGCVNGAWNNLAGVDTVTSVPTTNLYDGRQVRLRAGASPHDFILLTYDATYGKWVSDSWLAWHLDVDTPGPGSTGANLRVNVAGSEQNYFPYKVFHDAGLRLQIRNLAIVHGFSDDVHDFTSVTQGSNVNALPAAIDSTNVTGTVNAGIGQALKDSGWTLLNSSVVVRDYLGLIGRHSNGGASGQTKTEKGTAIHARWVSP